MKYIIKKGGKIEKLELKKIKKSLENALSNFDMSLEEKNNILEKVNKKVLDFIKKRNEITTAEIEAKILIELEQIAPQIIPKWQEYRWEKQNK